MAESRCRECVTGESPPKRRDVSIEQLEREMEEIRSPEFMEKLRQWLETRPLAVQEAARKYPPHQMYRVKEGAPYKYTVAGSIVSSFSIVEEGEVPDQVEVRFAVLRSPIGQAGAVAAIDEEHLEPISLEQLKSEVE